MEGTAGAARTRAPRCHPNSLICLRTSRSPSLLLIVSRLSRRSFPRARPISSLSLFSSLKYALSLGAQRRKVSSRAHGCTAVSAQRSYRVLAGGVGRPCGAPSAGTDPVPVSQRPFACCECGGLSYLHSRREDPPQTARVASGGTAHDHAVFDGRLCGTIVSPFLSHSAPSFRISALVRVRVRGGVRFRLG